MNLLVLSPVLPHAPVDGDRVRLYHFLRLLSLKHRVVLAAFCSREEERRAAFTGTLRESLAATHTVLLPPLRRGANAVAGLFSGLPLNVVSAGSAAMRDLVAALTAREKFDAVFCYRLKMAPYALATGLPGALDFTDSMQAYFTRRADLERNPFKRFLWRRESRKLASYEARCVRRFGACFVNSAADGELLSRHSGRPVEVVPNGVDLDSFHPDAARIRKPGQMVFVGNMVYPPNVKAMVDFCRHSLPLIRRSLPEARLCIVGGNPVQAIRDLARQPGVTVTGAVADTRPYVWESRVSICPVSLGAGRQNKVLEAFALGTPVVASSLAARGVEAKDGAQLLAADSPAEFAGAVVRLLREPRLGARLAGHALTLVRGRYSWTRSALRIEQGLKRTQRREVEKR